LSCIRAHSDEDIVALRLGHCEQGHLAEKDEDHDDISLRPEKVWDQWLHRNHGKQYQARAMDVVLRARSVATESRLLER
jgi:uncharacterized CHY-type Zn-finger protein